MYYQLIVELDERNTGRLYQGVSYLHEREKEGRNYTQDTLEISRNKIVLSFERARIDSKTVLYTPKSLVRYELQRALCYYLAVVGYMPKVKRIYFEEHTSSSCSFNTGTITKKKRKRIQELSDTSYATKWGQYKLTLPLQMNIASYIFTNGAGAKAVYDGITYFEAAQQNALRELRDCYRAAWSCLNALYTYLGGSELNEKDKLKKLGERFGKESFKDARKFVDSLTEEQFWSRLEWYQVAMQAEYRTKSVYDGVLRLKEDSMLVRRYDKYLNRIKRTEQDQAKFEENRKKNMNQVQTIISADLYDSATRLRFLICRYCYMLRNKSMHAEKAYPMFVINNPEYETSSIEKKLIEIMLLTAIGIMKEIVKE